MWLFTGVREKEKGETMARDGVQVHPVWDGHGYRLHLFHRGRYIGEYEASRAAEESGDRETKIQEAIGASELLLDACSRSSTCMIVRWNYKMTGKTDRRPRRSGSTTPAQKTRALGSASSTPSRQSRSGGSRERVAPAVAFPVCPLSTQLSVRIILGSPHSPGPMPYTPLDHAAGCASIHSEFTAL
jgi:hypothetical protein